MEGIGVGANASQLVSQRVIGRRGGRMRQSCEVLSGYLEIHVSKIRMGSFVDCKQRPSRSKASLDRFHSLGLTPGRVSRTWSRLVATLINLTCEMKWCSLSILF